MRYRGMIEVFFEVDADNEIQAEEDAAVKLIHMIQNDEVAINLWPLPSSRDAAEQRLAPHKEKS